MANSIYLTLNGDKQGLISQGCSSAESIGNKYQLTHKDQILIYSFNHKITHEQNSLHHPVIVGKPIDKSTPLLGIAISDNELLTCKFDFYRTNMAGFQELYFTILLEDATLAEFAADYPHSVTHNDIQPQEILTLRYKSIDWKHHAAGTGGYSLWQDRIYAG